MNRGIHICIFSVHFKKGPQARCATCGRIPVSDEEKARSLVLSTDYYLPETDYLGKSDEELRAIAEAIRNGNRFQFDDAELKRLLDYAKLLEAMTPRQLAWEGFVWYAPALAVFIALGLYFY